MKLRYKYILFDLDGTLSKSGEGVKAGICYTMRKLGRKIPDLSDYSLFVGPALTDTFQNVCKLPKDDIKKAIGLYGNFYTETGKYQNEAYQGIDELLKKLKSLGAVLGVATTKNEDFAGWVLKYIGLCDYFDAVCGVTPDYRIHTKHQVMTNALKKIGCTNLSGCVMIGDSEFDVQGAKLTGCDFIGVSYCYGNISNMKKSGMSKLADSSEGLFELLLSQ